MVGVVGGIVGICAIALRALEIETIVITPRKLKNLSLQSLDRAATCCLLLQSRCAHLFRHIALLSISEC
jgi:hypothetical protein